MSLSDLLLSNLPRSSPTPSGGRSTPLLHRLRRPPWDPPWCVVDEGRRGVCQGRRKHDSVQKMLHMITDYCLRHPGISVGLLERQQRRYVCDRAKTELSSCYGCRVSWGAPHTVPHESRTRAGVRPRGSRVCPTARSPPTPTSRHPYSGRVGVGLGRRLGHMTLYTTDFTVG